MANKVEINEAELSRMGEAGVLSYLVERAKGVDELDAVANVVKKVTQSLFNNIARIAEERGTE